MAEREADMEEDAGNLPARHGNDGEEEDRRRLLGVVDEDEQLGDEDEQLGDEDEQLGDEDEQLGVEDEQLGVEDEQLGDEDAEAPESIELDAPAERSGHVAVVDRNIMYVWGGYKNGQNHGFVDLYLPQNEVWTYNMESGVWMKHVTGGNLHSMSGSCGTCLDGVFYLFGGHHARGNTNRIYRLRLRAPSLVWEEMKDLKGLPPSSKDKLGCWVHKNRLIFFGGYGYTPQRSHLGAFESDETYSVLPQWEAPKRGWNNHIHVLDLETSAWSQPITQGATPSPRAAHACATVGNRGYVFGGRFKNYRLNDLYYIDLETWEWHEMGVPQNLVGRSWHSFTPVSPDHIFLFGGFTTQRETLSDAWLYCISRNEWRPFNHSYSKSPRLWHTACSGPDGEVFVFGGCANNLLSHERAAHSNELLVFNVQPKSLVGFCMEAILQHREKLSSHWDCLPKHLLHSLKQRMSRVNTLGS